MEPTPELILGGVDKITCSRTFHLAARQRSFLAHIVKETLEGRSEHLKEYSIGIAVFGKEPSFDPRLHSIVRTKARRLRTKLAKYYDTEGRNDPVRIELPVGKGPARGCARPREAIQCSILAQMDDTASERTAWSQTYRCKVTGASGVAEEIARAIAEKLTSPAGLTARSGTPEDHPARTGSDPQAYKEYLQGLYFWNRHTMEGFAEAVGFFKRAIQRDARFARAYTNLAYAYLMLPVVNASLPSEVLPKVRAAASKALEIDPRSGEAHIALALPLVQDFQWREAGQRFRKGLDLSPSDAFGHAWHGLYLATMGRTGDALMEQERAVQLHPASPVTACCHGQTLYLLRRNDDAVRSFRRALALDPSLPRAHAGLGLAYLEQGNYAGAIAELERALVLTPGLGRVKADLGYAYARSGKKDKAREVLNEFLKLFRPSTFPALMIAEIYIGLGENDKAFQWLNKAIDQKDLAPFLTCDPLFDPLRADFGFRALLKRANLP